LIGSLSAHIVRFLTQRKGFFVLLVLSITGFLIYGTSLLRIEKDLYAVLPNGKEHARFNEIIQKNNLNKQVIFSLEIDGDEESCISIAEQLVEKLQVQFHGKLENIQLYQEVNEQVLLTHLQAASILLLSKEDYKKIGSILSEDSISSRMNKLNERMQGMRGFFMKQLFARDPLGILNEQLASLNPNSENRPFTVRDGLLFSRDEQQLLFTGTLIPDLKNSDELVAVHRKMEAFQADFNQKNKHQLSAFGTYQIAAENAIQVEKDTFLSMIISIVGIVLLLMLYYRSFLAPVYFILPAVFGMLFGAGLTGFVKPDINGISLATSSVLLGIVLDYSFHFYTHLKHSSSLIETVRSVSAPMVTGSFTTIAALAALLFTDSVVLQDFGLIALFTLGGSVLFTLWILPVGLHVLRIRIPKSVERHAAKNKKPFALRFAIVGFSLCSIYFVIQFNAPTFDADLNHLSFHTPELKAKEEAFTGIHPDTDKKLFIVCSGSDEEAVRKINWKIFTAIHSLPPSVEVSELISSAPYIIPDSVQKSGGEQWTRFWKTRLAEVTNSIEQNSASIGFSSQAFSPFYLLIEDPESSLENGEQLVQTIGINRMIYSDSLSHYYFTSIVVPKTDVSAVKKALASVTGAYVLDIADMTNSLVESVKDDFNYLLLFSALLVFLSLLVVYGRIELALFAFLPMVLGWIWIIGVTEWAGISFNFVNIVIATFIFGLGDDFSIFTTDGLIQQYKTGVNTLKSTQSAIILSAVTTIIGTGALYFAKHPAIHSIALISVIGISIILFITLYIQPLIFKWFVLNKKEKNKVPVTFFTLIYSLGLFSYFFIGSILLNLFLIAILFPFPAPKKRKRAFLNYLVSKLAKSTLYAGVHVKKRVHHSEKLDFSQPSVIVANHSSFLDILLVIMLHPKAIIMVKSWVYNSPVFGLFIRYAGYPFAEEGAESNIDIIKRRVADGYSIVIFPEGTRSADGEIKRFHKGAFHLAKELNLPIQPLLLIGAHEVNPKNDVLINRGELHVVPLDRVTSPQEETVRDFTKRVNQLMRVAYTQEKSRIGTPNFWSAEILKNYVFKGPVIEWYVRIKWQLEKRNFAFYNAQIGDRTKIYDIGCGYGYLSYFLHYCDTKRQVIGLDYDESKIAVAQNGRKKSANLAFTAADVREYPIEAADVFFINDVLHYLPTSDQYHLLERIVALLEPNGLLFIRDGLENDTQRHKKTKLTEWLSTNVFKFNKTTNSLYFIDENELHTFASKHGLAIEKIQHSTTTSNVLFILKKS
jgi:1-acyl-sn-glycerol-3-phosphate acyltransferase